MAELQKLEPTAPELLTPGGGSKLLSLDKQELAEWLDGLGEAAAGRFSVTPKIDGCAIALQYIEGHLTAAWTQSGADAMHLLRLVGNVPHTLAAPICAQIRGELYGLDGRQSTPAAALRRKVPTDGLVAVVDDGHRRRRLGVTTVAPRYALAMKR